MLGALTTPDVPVIHMLTHPLTQVDTVVPARQICQFLRMPLLLFSIASHMFRQDYVCVMQSLTQEAIRDCIDRQVTSAPMTPIHIDQAQSTAIRVAQ